MGDQQWSRKRFAAYLPTIAALPLWVQGLPLLGGLWCASALVDRRWFQLDQAIPQWDQADYLAGVLNYWQAFQQPQWFSGEWWTGLWQLSSKIPPLVYIATVPFLNAFGLGSEQSTLVLLLFSALLLSAVYAIGASLFTVEVGLWAAGFCVLMPGLYRLRLEFLLDYPLAAIVTLCFACLTHWQRPLWLPVRAGQGWGAAIGFGLTLGLALMVKQSALLFLLLPLLWVTGQLLWQRKWLRLVQMGGALGVTWLVIAPWYGANWLTVLTASKRATVDSAIAEGDPSLLSLDAWTFYLQQLPSLVSLPLLLVPLLGLLLFWRRSRISSHGSGDWDFAPKTQDYRQQVFAQSRRSLGWLLLFCGGAYLLSSLNVNKDARYAVPLLPIIAVILGYGFSLLPKSWRLCQSLTVGLATVLMLIQIFPVPGIMGWLPQRAIAVHLPYTGMAYPHAALAAEVVRQQPYLQSTIGVLPSTPAVNQHNLNYFGMLQNFQVYGRQVGTQAHQVLQDARSLTWFVTKTGNQGSIRKPEAQAALTQLIEQTSDFQLQKFWSLPNGDRLNLYQRRLPFLEVQQIAPVNVNAPLIQLDRVLLPERVPPGQPIPVTYEWSGAWEMLQSGLVLLTWRKPGEPGDGGGDRWLHDHGIGMGALHSRPIGVLPTSRFRVLERTAMLPLPTAAGTYLLEATYVNRKTGNALAIAVPPVSLQIDPTAPPVSAPEVDWVTQLRSLAATLPQGTAALERVFAEIARLGQYDPTQDYVTQTRQALAYRLQQDPQNRDAAYGLVLANLLKRRLEPTIAALQQVVKLDAHNPYAYAYLAFVNLYAFRVQDAQAAIDAALQLNPNLPELQALNGVAALMRGNFVQAWQNVQTYRAQARG